MRFVIKKILCVCVFVVQVHGAHVEVKGLFSLTMGSGNEAQVVRFAIHFFPTDLKILLIL